MEVLFFLFLVVAAVFFALAALSVTISKYNLVAAGLFFATLVPLVQTLRSL